MPDFDERVTSHSAAIELLKNLGYQYISLEDIKIERGKNLGNVLLENILQDQLRKINGFEYKGRNHHFTEENIHTAIQKLKGVESEAGLLKSNEAIYEMLTMGLSLKQTLEGDIRSFTLNYVDWENPLNNVFHVAEEFTVVRRGSSRTRRPDIILFVNGIPFVVIECKALDIKVEEAIDQLREYQNLQNIPKLFQYVQILIATDGQEIKYATVGTPFNFWSIWKENLEGGILEKILEDEVPTPQDKSLYSLCRPERLLEIAQFFTLFDGGDKKIARYQQFLVVRSALERIKEYENDGARKSGMVWHTQGSGKSLTMVWLTKMLISEKGIKNPQIIIVTDRENLDRQITDVLRQCDVEVKHATSGSNLLGLVQKKEQVITTLVQKFRTASKSSIEPIFDSNIVILADESHRTQFGMMADQMRRIFPNASYIGFTGTPLTKKEKDNFTRFGDLIEPHYTVHQAIEDGAVLETVYEGRGGDIDQNDIEMDKLFEYNTVNLTKDQKDELKRRFATPAHLNGEESIVYRRAVDISNHYRANLQGTGLKAQLVVDTKSTAIKYHEFLKKIGIVSSAVIISAFEVRESEEQSSDNHFPAIRDFWDEMMTKYGSEREYNKKIIADFKNPQSQPEILIVVDKLLTGFDAPVNTVLYLCRRLREHTLLQAIARVNRLYPGKDWGYVVDYNANEEELDKALMGYGALAGFNQKDLKSTFKPIDEVLESLPVAHLSLWNIFKDVKNKKKADEFLYVLESEKLREQFFNYLKEFSRIFSTACKSRKFLTEVRPETFETYRKDLRDFDRLRKMVRLHYDDEIVDYREYAPMMKKLLNTYIEADEISNDVSLRKIYSEEWDSPSASEDEVGTRADGLAHQLKKRITNQMEKDPVFNKKFSELIQETIDSFRQGKLPGFEYLEKVEDLTRRYASHDSEDAPKQFASDNQALALFATIRSILETSNPSFKEMINCAEEITIKISGFLDAHDKVNFWKDSDAVKQVKREILLYLHTDFPDKWKLEIENESLNQIVKQTMEIARNHVLGEDGEE